MAFSENLINSTGSFSKWGDGGDITSGSNGLTSTSFNSYARSSNTLSTTSNTYWRVSGKVKSSVKLSIDISMNNWGTKPFGVASNLWWDGSTLKSRITVLDVGDYDATVISGISKGDLITLELEYDNGTLTSYVEGTAYASYYYDLSSYSTWKPFVWVDSTSDFVQSYEEVVESGISASKRIINC